MAARAEELGPDDLEVVVTPMRRRHLRGVLRIEHRVYPRPWSLGLYMGELALPSTRVYLVARIGTERGRLRRADDRRRGRPHHDRRGRPAVAPPGRRHPAAARPARPGAGARRARTSPSRCGCPTPAAQAMYRRFGFAPAGVRRGYYVDNAEDAMVMWAHGIDDRGERDRPRPRIAAAVPGRTVLGGLA